MLLIKPYTLVIYTYIILSSLTHQIIGKQHLLLLIGFIFTSLEKKNPLTYTEFMKD